LGSGPQKIRVKKKKSLMVTEGWQRAGTGTTRKKNQQSEMLLKKLIAQKKKKKKKPKTLKGLTTQHANNSEERYGTKFSKGGRTPIRETKHSDVKQWEVHNVGRKLDLEGPLLITEARHSKRGPEEKPAFMNKRRLKRDTTYVLPFKEKKKKQIMR